MFVKYLNYLSMSATVTVSVRIPLEQHRVIKRAAKAMGAKVATFVRAGAYHHAVTTLAMLPTADERAALDSFITKRSAI